MANHTLLRRWPVFKAPLPGRFSAPLDSQTGESDAGGVQEELRLWDLARDEVARTLTDGENAKFVSSDFSPDGRTLAVGLVRRKEANQTTSIRLWSIAENRWDPTLVDLDGTLLWLAFSPDGKTLAIGGIRSVAGRVPIEVSQLGVWNSATGKNIWRSETVHFEAKEPAFSSDGARVATRGSGPSGADIVMRDATNGRIVAVLRDALAERVVFAYSPVGSLLATSDGLHVELRDSETNLVRAVLYPFPAKP